MTKRVAFIANDFPTLNVAGHLSYNYEIILFLAQHGFPVDVIVLRPRPWRAWFRLPGFDDLPVRIRARGVLIRTDWGLMVRPRDVMHFLAARAILRLRAALPFESHRNRTARAVLGRFISREEYQYAKSVLVRLRPEILFIDTIFLAPILKERFGDCRTFIVTHDLFCQRAESLRLHGFAVEPMIDREGEAALLSKSDVVVAIQDEEKRLIQSMVPSKPVLTVGHPVRPARAGAGQRVPGRCLFVGSMGPHNIDGLRWLLREVWPIVVEQRPQAELHVYGGVCEVITQPGPKVVQHGWTPDLKEAYLSSSIALVPLRAGSGLKIKLVHYLAHGLPCVVTPMGAQGFGAPLGRPFLIADGAADFARAICGLLRDGALRSALSERAYRYCERLSPAHVFRELKAEILAEA